MSTQQIHLHVYLKRNPFKTEFILSFPNLLLQIVLISAATPSFWVNKCRKVRVITDSCLP